MFFGRRRHFEFVPPSDEVRLEEKHREIEREFKGLLHKHSGPIALVPPSYEVGLEGINRDFQTDVYRMDRFNRVLGYFGVSLALLSTGALLGNHFLGQNSKTEQNAPAEIQRQHK